MARYGEADQAMIPPLEPNWRVLRATQQAVSEPKLGKPGRGIPVTVVSDEEYARLLDESPNARRIVCAMLPGRH